MLAADDPRHGTNSGFTNDGCRCDPCREAWRAYMRSYRKRTGYKDVKINNRARHRAAKWVRNEHPAVWRSLLDQARVEVDAERQGGAA